MLTHIHRYLITQKVVTSAARGRGSKASYDFQLAPPEVVPLKAGDFRHSDVYSLRIKLGLPCCIFIIIKFITCIFYVQTLILRRRKKVMYLCQVLKARAVRK